jgi:glycerol-3-phosphate dehydrogenase
MQKVDYDIVVIGAGINGAGVAQAAAALGYRVLLLEKNNEPGLETSSSSSKLIHGGLRYLETMQFSLVRESLQERELLLKLAPDLVRILTFNIPLYADTCRSCLQLHAGLSLYALLAGMHKHNLYRVIKKNDWGRLDGLTTRNLKTVFQYQDAQTDDRALTLAVLASAIQLGAACEFNAQMLTADLHGDLVAVEYLQANVQKTTYCSVLVNAAGPRAYALNQCMSPAPAMKKPELVQGTHLQIKRNIKQAYYMEAPQDRRGVFLLPWKGHALLGTTENSFTGDPADLRVLEQERSYLMEVYAHYFPGSEAGIIGEMAGLRVLPVTDKQIFSRSRDIVLETDHSKKPRVITLVGGKLTVYRRSAMKVMEMLRPSLPDRKAIADTARLKINPVDKL